MPLPQAIFIATIDLEEDNWGFHRSNVSAENVREIPRLQELFDRYEIRPTYLVTHQVALLNWAVNILADIFSAGKCEIGAHLHPWNTPPITEDLSARSSMLKNLPYELQLAKIKTLTDQLERSFGTRPKSFRAGRWGLGPDTVEALVACGYEVDSSVTPIMSWLDEGEGPSYESAETELYWYPRRGDEKSGKPDQKILEVPVSIGYNRWPFDFWHRFYTWLAHPWLKPLHPIGLLNRSGILRKIWLSPEMNSSKDMIKLTDTLTIHGISVLNFTFHTPSLLPGKSPFIRNSDDLENFYSEITNYFEYLSQATRFESLTLSEVRKAFDKDANDTS